MAYVHGVTSDLAGCHAMSMKVQGLTEQGLTDFETVSQLLTIVSVQINCFVTFSHISLNFAQIYALLTIQKNKKTIVNICAVFLTIFISLFKYLYILKKEQLGKIMELRKTLDC